MYFPTLVLFLTLCLLTIVVDSQAEETLDDPILACVRTKGWQRDPTSPCNDYSKDELMMARRKLRGESFKLTLMQSMFSNLKRVPMVGAPAILPSAAIMTSVQSPSSPAKPPMALANGTSRVASKEELLNSLSEADQLKIAQLISAQMSKPTFAMNLPPTSMMTSAVKIPVGNLITMAKLVKAAATMVNSTTLPSTTTTTESASTSTETPKRDIVYEVTKASTNVTPPVTRPITTTTTTTTVTPVKPFVFDMFKMWKPISAKDPRMAVKAKSRKSINGGKKQFRKPIKTGKRILMPVKDFSKCQWDTSSIFCQVHNGFKQARQHLDIVAMLKQQMQHQRTESSIVMDKTRN